MKYTSTLNFLVLTVLMLGGLMGSPVMADTSFDDIIVGSDAVSDAGGGPHVKVLDGATRAVEEESEQVEELVEEEGSSDDTEQSGSHSDPECRYVPVRRVAHL